MDYPGDFPPTPEERAGLRLEANAAWLARAKHHDDEAGNPPITLRDGRVTTAAQISSDMMERDNRNALADARRGIAAERKVHRCYICGRSDLPPWNRLFGLLAAGFLGLYLYLSETNRGTGIVGFLAAATLGAAFASAMYTSVKPTSEDEARERFDETPPNR